MSEVHMRERLKVFMWIMLCVGLFMALMAVGWLVESHRYAVCMAHHDDWLYCIVD